MPTIRKATTWFSSFKTGSLNSSLRPEDINRVLGFEAEAGDPRKVQYEWNFTIDGVNCAIWDYKGVRWSTFGPTYLLDRVFPGMVSKD